MDNRHHILSGSDGFCPLLERIASDERLLPTHIGLVMALFYYHPGHNIKESFQSSRSKLMRTSRIRSATTYHKCLSELVRYGYIEYHPSWHPAAKSKFRFVF